MDDIGKAAAVVADMRKIIRQDPRIIQKLHRRVFIDKLTREQASCISEQTKTSMDNYSAFDVCMSLPRVGCAVTCLSCHLAAVGFLSVGKDHPFSSPEST